MVCEPLTQRYERILPPKAEHLFYCFRIYGCYLADGGDAAVGGMPNFRVVCGMYRNWRESRVGVFTAGGAWSWRDSTDDPLVPCFYGLSRIGRAGGSWYFRKGKTMTVFDGSTAEFSSSSFTLPAIDRVGGFDPVASGHGLYVTEGRDGKPRMLTMVDGILTVFVMRPGGGGELVQWVLEKRIWLLEVTRGLPEVNVLRRGVGFVLLLHRIGTEAGARRYTFALDLETAEAERVQEHEDTPRIGFPCELPWPPTLLACLQS
uniref:F-box associated domain-containing protein n=1 Tax=Leersia perrieri TaxID=77586 RepID=A0A0D9XCH2_9ORYZ